MSRFLHPRFRNLEAYTPGEQPKVRKWIKLNTNENPYPPAPAVAAAVGSTIDSLNLYSEISCESVRKPLAEFLQVKEEQVFVANGSDEVLAFTFWALCPNGAAFADITYGFYEVYSRMYEVNAQIIPLADDLRVCTSDYHELGKTIYLANPNSPTGLALSRAEIEEILRHNQDSLVIVDEAYVAFGAESAVPLLDNYENLLVVGTFSKARSLAGARLGYAVGSVELMEDLSRMKYGFNPYNVNSMTLAAAKASLQEAAYYENCLFRVCATREKTIQALERLGFVCTNSRSNFLFITHPEHSAESLFAHLREEGILVRWFQAARIRNFLRVSVGTEEEMEAFVEALHRIIEKTKGGIS